MKQWVMFLPLVLAAAVVGQGTFSFGGEDKDHIQVVGVCDVSVDSIKCWDPTGKPSAVVEEIAKKQMEEDYQVLRLKFKKRNRLIIVRHSSHEASKALFTGELQDAKGERIQEANAVAGTNGTVVHKMYWYTDDGKAKTLDINAIVNTQVAEKVKLPFKAGGEAKLGQYTVKIETISEMKDDVTVRQLPFKCWQVVYKVEKPEGTENVSIQAQPLDGNGAQIIFADKDGNPVEKNSPELRARRPLFMNTFSNPANASKTNAWICSIRPDRVSELQVSGFSNRKVSFKSIALDSN